MVPLKLVKVFSTETLINKLTHPKIYKNIFFELIAEHYIRRFYIEMN
jgi:hypothetical protein